MFLRSICRREGAAVWAIITVYGSWFVFTIKKKHSWILSVTCRPRPPSIHRRLFGCGGETGKHTSGFADNANVRQTVSCLHVFEVRSHTSASLAHFLFYWFHKILCTWTHEVVNLVKSPDWFWLGSRDDILTYKLKTVPNSGPNLEQTAVNILTVYWAVYLMRHFHWLSQSSGSNSAGVQAQASFHLRMTLGSVSSHLETCHFQDISIWQARGREREWWRWKVTLW